MDKKNLFLVFLLSALFLGVNWYFESEHQKAVLTWSQEQEKSALTTIDAKTPPSKPVEETASLPHNQEEKFFLLENGVIQLLFSNRGGALAEANLSFQGETHPNSVVKETDYDRMVFRQEPQNSYFPSHPFSTPNQSALTPTQIGGYYPLLRRDLIQKDPQKSERIPPKFYALNIVSDFPEVANQLYEVVEFTENSITFEAKTSLRKIRKKFTLEPNYCLLVEITVDGDSKGLWLTSGIPEVEWISGAPAPALKYRITQNNKSEVRLIDLPEKTTAISSLVPDWVVNSNGFLGIIMDPLNGGTPGFRVDFIKGGEAPSRLVEIDEKYDRFPRDKMAGYLLKMPIKGGADPSQFRLFLGPFDTKLLEKVDQTYSDPKTGYNPDYIACQTFHGYFAFISEPFASLFVDPHEFFPHPIRLLGLIDSSFDNRPSGYALSLE